MMQPSYPSLSASDCAKILAELDACISILERTKKGMLTGAELSLKSMLTVLRKEVNQQAKALASDSSIASIN